MFAKVTLFTGQTIRDVAIPESAIVDDNGKPTVFVMEGGESFFKRAIRLGVRSGGYVQVLDGSEGRASASSRAAPTNSSCPPRREPSPSMATSTRPQGLKAPRR